MRVGGGERGGVLYSRTCVCSREYLACARARVWTSTGACAGHLLTELAHHCRKWRVYEDMCSATRAETYTARPRRDLRRPSGAEICTLRTCHRQSHQLRAPSPTPNHATYTGVALVFTGSRGRRVAIGSSRSTEVDPGWRALRTRLCQSPVKVRSPHSNPMSDEH